MSAEIDDQPRLAGGGPGERRAGAAHRRRPAVSHTGQQHSGRQTGPGSIAVEHGRQGQGVQLAGLAGHGLLHGEGREVDAEDGIEPGGDGDAVVIRADEQGGDVGAVERLPGDRPGDVPDPRTGVRRHQDATALSASLSSEASVALSSTTSRPPPSSGTRMMMP